MKIFKRLNLICLLLVVILFSMQVKTYAKEDPKSNKDYYYQESIEMISRRLKGQDINSQVATLFKNNHLYYYNKLNENEKILYDELVSKVKAINYEELAITTSDNKQYLELVFLNELNDNIIKAFLYDYAGLIYFNLGYVLSLDKKTLKLELSANFNNKTSFKNNLNLYLKVLLNYSEMALKEPHSYKRAYALFDLLFTKNTNLDSETSEFYKLLTPNTYQRALKQLFDLSYLKGLYINSTDSSDYLYLGLLNKYFPINTKRYLEEKTNKYIYDNFLNFVSSPQSDNPLFNKDDIYSKAYKNQYQYFDIEYKLDQLVNRYTNRVIGGINPNPSFKKINPANYLSTAPYDEYKMPLTNISVKNKTDVNLDIKYFYNNDFHSEAPTDEDFYGEVLMYVKSLSSDTCIDTVIPYKVAKRHLVNIINSLDPVKNPTITYNIFNADFIPNPPRRDNDGAVFDKYDNEAIFLKSVVSDINIRELYRKPQLEFRNSKGDVVDKGAIERFDSTYLLKEAKPDVSAGNIFVGYKIIGIKGQSKLPKELTNKYLGLNPDKDEIIVNNDYILEEIIEKIDLYMKGSFFKKIKQVKTKEGEIPTFRVHPFFTIPSLGTIYFKNNALYPKSYELVNTDIVSLRENKVKEYDLLIRAKGAHSFEEAEIRTHIIIDKNIFLTTGWLKKYWWAVLLVLIAIILLPIILKIIFKAIKKSKAD